MDEQLKKRLAGAAVVVLLAFALVSLLPQAQDTPASDTQVVTIPLSPELIGTPDVPPASETTPSSLQAPAAGNESTLNPAELAAASGGDDDAPPDGATAAPPSSKAPGAGHASGAMLAKAEPAASSPEAAAPAKPALKPVEKSPAKLAEKPAAAKSPDKSPDKAADKAAEKPTEKAVETTPVAPARSVASAAKPVIPPGPADKTSTAAPPAGSVANKTSPPPAKPASAAAPVVAARPEPATAASASPAAPRGGNWFVQIGGYADIDNARQAQKQVRSHNQDCIIAPVDTNKGTLYRVRAGPYRDRETAQAAQARLSAAGFASAALVAP